MGIFSNLFKSKYDKLTREDIVEAICNLENQQKEIEDSMESDKKQKEVLLAKGRAEKDKNMKLLYAKKINAIDAANKRNIERSMYLNYNIQTLTKLKESVDDNKFFKNATKASLGNLLSDQKGLAKFLGKATDTRAAAENALIAADDTFKTYEEAYEPNRAIYGMNEEDNALLAMFEQEEQVADEESLFAEGSAAKKKTSDET